MFKLIPHLRGAHPGELPLNHKQMALIQAVRLTFLVSILIITVLFQASQPEFTSLEVLFPVYVLLALSFLINTIYLFFFERAIVLVWPTAALFVFDAIFVTTIIYCTGISQSIFLFFYLINIILCGLVFLRRGALALALWTSILYSFLVVIGNEDRSQAFYFAFVLNLSAFVAVALLSGYLAEQLNFAGHELKARRRDLAELTDLNDLIVENVGTGLMTIGSDSRILRVNHAASEILDREKTLLDASIDSVFEGFSKLLAQRLTLSESGKVHFDIHYVNRREERLTLEMIVSPLHPRRSLALEEVASTDGYILIFQDLTRVRRLEFAVRQSEKLAAVGQLAAGIAHEIRNPLASISGCIQLLESMGPGDSLEEKSRLMTIVLREIDRLNNLISEFLDFVRPDSQQYSPLSVNDVLREVADMARVHASLRHDVVQVLDFRSQRPIAGHFDKLKQAFLNMVINAYQAMESIVQPRLQISTHDEGNKVVVVIRDNGVGINDQNLQRIFEPFHTTKAKGTGLGLAMTHKILEGHGARIFVESKLGMGTEFSLEFPAALTEVEREQGAPLKKANG